VVAVVAVVRQLAELGVQGWVVQVARLAEQLQLQTQQAVVAEQTTQAQALMVDPALFTFDGRFETWHTLHRWSVEAFTQ